jgi:hypothetical protein
MSTSWFNIEGSREWGLGSGFRLDVDLADQGERLVVSLESRLQPLDQGRRRCYRAVVGGGG